MLKRASDWTYMRSHACLRSLAHIYVQHTRLSALLFPSEKFRHKSPLFPEKCIKTAFFPCARLDLCERQAQMFHNMPWSNATMIRAPPLRRNRACSHASQTPFGHSVREFSPIWGSFAQEHKVKCAQIRAILWA